MRKRTTKKHWAPYGHPQATEGAPGAVGFAAFSPHLGRPHTASSCTVFGVGFAFAVVFEQSYHIDIQIDTYMDVLYAYAVYKQRYKQRVQVRMCAVSMRGVTLHIKTMHFEISLGLLRSKWNSSQFLEFKVLKC